MLSHTTPQRVLQHAALALDLPISALLVKLANSPLPENVFPAVPATRSPRLAPVLNAIPIARLAQDLPSTNARLAPHPDQF